MRFLLLAGLLLAVPWPAAAAAAAAAGTPPTAQEVASRLAAVGPRADEKAQAKAVEILRAAMQQAGLQSVRATPVAGEPEVLNLEGTLPGQGRKEIVLSAHYDTVRGSPGAGDDASGCGVVLAAVADLRRTPLRHTVRVVLFDAEEPGLLGSRGWVKDLGEAGRDNILAGLNVEMVGWAESAGPLIHTLPVRSPDRKERILTPGWLVHFVQQGGTAAGWPLKVADNRFPLLAQYVVRAVDVRFGADANALLAHGVPAVTVSDSSFSVLDPAYHEETDTASRLDAGRLDQWTQVVTATVRRLDGLTGRPLADDQYLAAFGRVWSRRALLWAGFTLWAVHVFRGLPGRWRGATPQEHRRQGRLYLPGFLFRVLLLLAVFFAPVFAVLLFPAAVLSLFPLRRTWARLLGILLGVLPLLVYGAAVWTAVATRIARPGLQVGRIEAALVLGTLVAFGLFLAGGSGAKSQAGIASNPDDGYGA